MGCRGFKLEYNLIPEVSGGYNNGIISTQGSSGGSITTGIVLTLGEEYILEFEYVGPSIDD